MKEKKEKTMKDNRNALEKLYGYTLTPLQITAYYKSWLAKLKKLKRCGRGFEQDVEQWAKKIDDLLKAAKEVYGESNEKI